MSGGIFPQLDDQDDNMTRNPLLCCLCKDLLKDPCVLQCYHTFCSACLNGKTNESKITCPFCGKSTTLKENLVLPPKDPLLSFLIESSVEEWPPCSNCDNVITPHDSDTMFFCNTCGQALCGTCRDETHKARMFTKHDVIHMSKRTKDIYKKCSLHGEPYIMFSTLNKTMLCINCFRDMSTECRAHCIDLDTAYNQGCKKLDAAVVSIRDLQLSVRDGISLFRDLLDELSHNTDTERESIHKLCQSLQDIIISTRHSLLEDIQRQYDAKQQLFCKQLDNLRILLPTIQVHLIICTTFSSSANKYEFLHLGYSLMDRLCAIAHMSSPLRPTQSSTIKTNFRSELSRNLDPLISDRKSVRDMAIDVNPTYDREVLSSLSSRNKFFSPTLFTSLAGNHVSGLPASPSPLPAYTRKMGINGKLKITDVSAGFTEHCKNFEVDYKELLTRFAKMKEQVQELQRDVTLRKCLTKKGKVVDIQNECSKLEVDIKKQHDTLDGVKLVLEKKWEEQLQRITTEQDIYNAQIIDLRNLMSDNQCLSTVVKRLEPFIKSITAVVEKISPRLRMSLHKEDRNECIQALLEQINTIQPDSQQRVDAIMSQEEQRQNKPTVPSPFEESLIQTRGMLKTPMKDGIPIRKDVDGTPLRDGTPSPIPVGRVMDMADSHQTETPKKTHNENENKGNESNLQKVCHNEKIDNSPYSKQSKKGSQTSANFKHWSKKKKK